MLYHYYSPMNFKALLILALILCTSACGHLKNQSTSSDDLATDQPPKSDTSATGDIAGTAPDAPLIPTLKPDVESDIKVDDINIPATPVEPADLDVISRIRSGFSFPELNTTDVNKHEKWASSHNTYLKNLFAKAEPFLFFIVEEIERRKLPMELALLPAVESAFDPGAVSRSRAAGLWQFVPNTGRGFGLRQDWWYDGRHDPYSSTFAALDYLEQLHKMFDGDWFIALAAYNAGPGTLRREIRKAKRKGLKTDYVSLKLRTETRRYIPKLVALKHIIQYPEKYNVTLPKIANKPYFEVIELPGQIDLVEFAKQSNVDRQLLRHLNRGFKRWATAPEGPHRLLIPLNAERSVDYARLAVKNTRQVNYRNHKIKNGDTLSGIARIYGVSVAGLRSANQLSNNRIRAGRNLMIPIRGSSTPSTHLAKNSKVTHRVSAGDTLWSISRQYKVKLDQLMNWNGLRSGDVLSLNQMLTVFLK